MRVRVFVSLCAKINVLVATASYVLRKLLFNSVTITLPDAAFMRVQAHNKIIMSETPVVTVPTTFTKHKNRLQQNSS